MDGHSLDHEFASTDGMFALDNQSARQRSAQVVLNALFKLAQPQSVIDVGCGDGAWLQAAQDLDVPAAFGVDGQERPKTLAPAAFLRADPREPGFAAQASTVRDGKKFDLVLCLGKAEHVPSDRSAEFVEELCSLGDMVLFSAAVPFQTRPKPVNPQWAEVWAQHFRHARFRCFDILRGALWADPAVDWHVAQNLLLFVREDSAAFAGFPAQPTEGPLSLVHPQAWLASVVQRSRAHRETAQAELAALMHDWAGPTPSEPILHAPGSEAAAHLATLQSGLEQANARAEALRQEKAQAEASAADEFKLRMHMENDRLLSDAAEKALHAANDALRAQLEAVSAEAAQLPRLTEALDRSLERERIMQKQLAELRDALEQSTATIGRLTEQYQEIDERLSILLGSSSWRLTSPLRATRRMLGGGDLS